MYKPPFHLKLKKERERGKGRRIEREKKERPPNNMRGGLPRKEEAPLGGIYKKKENKENILPFHW